MSKLVENETGGIRLLEFQRRPEDKKIKPSVSVVYIRFGNREKIFTTARYIIYIRGNIAVGSVCLILEAQDCRVRPSFDA